jgi:hypothetical protein
LGSVCLAFAPLLAEGPMPWHVSPQRVFPIMIGMIAFPVVMRGMRTAHDPSPINIQTTIRIGILTIIPLAACFALLGAGPIWGMAVIALVVPSIVLAMRFRVT